MVSCNGLEGGKVFAPRREEVHERSLAALQHLLIEVLAGEVNGTGACRLPTEPRIRYNCLRGLHIGLGVKHHGHESHGEEHRGTHRVVDYSRGEKAKVSKREEKPHPRQKAKPPEAKHGMLSPRCAHPTLGFSRVCTVRPFP